MNSDDPLQHFSDDRLNRKTFACALAKGLARTAGSPPLVVGLEGDWGSGKTSLINMIKDLLSSEKETERSEGCDFDLPEMPLVIDFQPWLYSGLHSLLEIFLKQVASEINATWSHRGVKALLFGSKVTGLIEDLSKYASAFEPFAPGIGAMGSVIGGGARKLHESMSKAKTAIQPNLSSLKEKISGKLEKNKISILVIIDDIDRLRPAEIRTVMQLVKAIGNFRGITYLLAYDRLPVEKALSEENVHDGGEYLEKIVQVNYQVPRPGQVSLRRLLIQNIELLIKEQNLELGDAERQNWQHAVDECLRQAVRHPRDIVRLINRVSLLAPALQGNVDFGDFLVFEMLSIRFPDIQNIISQAPQKFVKTINFTSEDRTSTHYEGFRSPYRKEGNDNKSTFTEHPKDPHGLLKPLNKKEGPVAEALLEFLFPGITREPNFLSNSDPDDSGIRLRTGTPLLMLLGAGTVDGLPAPEDVQAILKKPKEREAIGKAILDDNYWGAWIPLLRDKIQELPPDTEDRFIDWVVDLTLKTYTDLNYADGQMEPLVNDAGKLILDTIRNTSDAEKRKPLYLQITKNNQLLALSEYIVFRAVAEHGKWKKDQKDLEKPKGKRTIEDWAIVEKGKKQWLKQVQTVFSDYEKAIVQPGLLSIMYRWGQLGENGFAEVGEFIAGLIENRSEKGISFLIEHYRLNKSRQTPSIFYSLPNIQELLEKLKNKPDLNDSGELKSILSGVLTQQNTKESGSTGY